MANKDFVVKNSLIVGDTATINGVQIDLSNATSGQVLKFDGSKFAPAADNIDPVVSTYSQTIGNGTNSTYVVDHYLGTKNISVIVRDANSPYDTVAVRWEATTTNSITLDFSTAVSASSRRVFIASAGTLSYYTSTIGDGTSSSIDLVHNLGSRDVYATVVNSDSPYEIVEVGVLAPSANKLTLDFSTAPQAGSLVASVFLPLEGYEYSSLIGDGSSTSFVLTHNLGTRDINIIVRNTQSPYQILDTRWEATTTNTVTVYFTTAPENSSKKVTVFTGIGGKKHTPSFGDISTVVPSTSTSSGVTGDMAWDSNYIYVCTEPNSWKKASLINYDSVDDDQITSTTISSNATTTIDSFASASFRSAEFTVQAVQGTKYTLIKCLAIHDGSTVFTSQYGRTEIGSPAIPITISSDINDGVVRLRATATDAASTNVTTSVTKKTIVGGSSNVSDITSTSVTTNSATTIDSFSALSYRSAEFTIQVTQGSKYTFIKCLAIHNGSSVTVSQYGRTEIGSPVIPVTFTSDINDNYVRLRCTITDASSTNANVNVIKERLTV